MSVSIGDFPQFFAAVNGDKAPFAWQRRLAEALVVGGRWPDRLAAPTGAGKTSVIDAHVFAVAASSAAGNFPRPPRRLAMVVDRRALVDDQYERALRLAGLLRDSFGAAGIVGRVANCLLALRGQSAALDQAPLVVARLRGGEPASRAWREDPRACAVICTTPDMCGSRLLFRGYGTRRAARPVEAAMLAVDCAVVVDEAHLSRQFLATTRRLAELQGHAPLAVGPMPLQPVETTATPAPGIGTEIGVREEDLDADEVLAARLRARKDLRLVPREGWPLPKGAARQVEVEAIAELSVGLREELGPTIGCFMNTVKAAVDVAAALRGRGLEVVLVCGRLRGVDLARLRASRPGLLSLAGDSSVDVLVTTQSLEVGVDLDLSGAVSELAPATALAQRAGRVNRVGARPHSIVCVVVPAGPVRDDDRSGPYEGPPLDAARAWLEPRASNPGGLAPWALRTDPPPAPDIRILHRLEQWDAWHLSRSFPVLSAEPDLDVWLSDDLEPDLDVAFIVRSGLTGDPDADVPYLSACPIHAAEAFPVALSRARALLDNIAAGQPAYVEAEGAFVLVSSTRLRPSAVVVVGDASLLLRGGVVDDEPVDPGDDVAEEASMHHGRLDLRIGPAMPLAAFAGESTIATAFDEIAGVDVDSRPGRNALAQVLLDLGARIEDPRWRAHVGGVGRALKDTRLVHMEVSVLGEADGGIRLISVIDRRRIAEEQLQVLTPAGDTVALADHQAAVAERVEAIGTAVGLGGGLSALVREAGRHHDDGKSDARFQIALDAGGVVLAKSGMTSRHQARAAHARSGLPTGWRHEQLSAAAAWQALTDLPEDERALVVRLIGCSHGHGRPDFIHPSRELIQDGSPLLGTCRELFDGGRWDELLEQTDLRFGVWGTAYLEAVLRAADVQVSREGR